VGVDATYNASRTLKVTYWILTVGLAWELGFGGVSDLMRLQYVRVIVAHLGYPPYLLSILGFWKVLAAIVLLVPQFPLVKEWAYAGSFFVFTGAAASHIAAGDGFQGWIGPAIGVAITVASWALRPASRRVALGCGTNHSPEIPCALRQEAESSREACSTTTFIRHLRRVAG
jgi:DoxX-like family